MKAVRRWECVGLETTRDGWFTLRIRIHWWAREHGGPESNLRLGIRRERFAHGDQFHRLCRLAPDLVQEIFRWWQRVQLLEGFPEAIAGKESKDGAKKQRSHGYGVVATCESAQTGRSVANEAASLYQQFIDSDIDHNSSSQSPLTARTVPAPSSAAPVGRADVFQVPQAPSETEVARMQSFLRTEQIRREAAATKQREQIERQNERERADLAERDRRMAQES